MIPLRDNIPARRPPLMNWALIALNTLAFLWELSLPEPALRELLGRYGLVPAALFTGQWTPLLTSPFLHGGVFHLVSNLWILWIFGDNVEDRMGRGRYLAFYLSCGVIAGLIQALTQPGSTLPTVGASGAIAGVLGAYFVLYPGARVVTMFLIVFWPVFVELPAFVFLGLWFAAQLLSGTLALGQMAAGGIAWWAHVGGFVAGLSLYRAFLHPRRRLRRRPKPPWLF